MDAKEKFLKIITKAESNGFSFRNNSEIDNIDYIGMGRFKMDMTITHDQESGSVEEKTTFTFNITEVFFNHNFAKAFFGTQEECADCETVLRGSDWKEGNCPNCHLTLEGDDCSIDAWKKHLQAMVLKEDIMEYLIKHVG